MAKKFLWKCAASDGQCDFKGEGKQNQKCEMYYSRLFVSDSVKELKRMAASHIP